MDEQYVTRHEYMERIGRSDDRMHGFDRRLSKVEEFGEKLSSMAITMQGMLVTLQTMQAEQTKQGERLRKIEEEPGDTWKKVKWTVLACVLTGVVTLVITAMGTLIIAKGGI